MAAILDLAADGRRRQLLSGATADDRVGTNDAATTVLAGGRRSCGERGGDTRLQSNDLGRPMATRSSGTQLRRLSAEVGGGTTRWEPRGQLMSGNQVFEERRSGRFDQIEGRRVDDRRPRFGGPFQCCALYVAAVNRRRHAIGIRPLHIRGRRCSGSSSQRAIRRRRGRSTDHRAVVRRCRCRMRQISRR